MTLGRALEGIASPLDGLRTTAFGWALRRPLLPGLLTRKDRRIAAIATTHALLALALSVLFPTFLFALGPVLLGVAHVAADIRYLVLRRELASWWRTAIWFACAALIGVRVLEETGLAGSDSRFELGLAFVWMGLALVAGARQAGSYKRALLAAPLLALGCWTALKNPLIGLMVAVHVHNVIALILWAGLFQRQLRTLLLPLAVIGAGAIALVSGALQATILGYGKLEAFGLGLGELSSWLAPGLAPKYAVGLTVAYVFLQSVHYAVWLILIPQSDSKSAGTLTFRMSARSLLRDFGGAPVLAIALGALVVIGAACFQIHEARRVYLSLAMFHVYLEFALLAYFFARGQRPAPFTSLAPPAGSGSAA